jgi:hypothetical protein
MEQFIECNLINMHGVNNGVQTYVSVSHRITYSIYQFNFTLLLLLLLLPIYAEYLKLCTYNKPVSWV